MIFEWDYYINKYDDLKNSDIKDEENAYNHWVKHGQKEQRVYVDVSIFFNWKQYIKENADLKNIKNEEDAWKHYLYYGRKETRKVIMSYYLIKYCV